MHAQDGIPGSIGISNQPGTGHGCDHSLLQAPLLATLVQQLLGAGWCSKARLGQAGTCEAQLSHQAVQSLTVASMPLCGDGHGKRQQSEVVKLAQVMIVAGLPWGGDNGEAWI